MDIVEKASINVKIQLIINEEEARALEAIAGYDEDAYTAVFYNCLGKAYLQPYENGLRSFLSSIRKELPNVLARVDNARKAFKEQ